MLQTILVALLLAGHASAADRIVTASERETYFRIGQDIVKFVAPQAKLDLEAVPSAGSVENVRRLRSEPGVRFALVQSDVYQGYVDMAAGGNRAAAELIRPLRVILPLYNEEIYFVARADAPWHFVHEIREAKINAGEVGSGTALTTTTLYRLMFGKPPPENVVSYLPHEDALVKLVTDKSIDVVAIVAGQPATLLADMKPEARQYIKLLRVDPEHPATKAALKTYFLATVRTESYRNLLAENMPALAVKAFLVTYDFQRRHSEDALRRFARSLCLNLSTLREQGHPKWREVTLALPELGRGWSYSPLTTPELRACTANRPREAPKPKPRARAPGGTPPQPACSRKEALLGLCKPS